RPPGRSMRAATRSSSALRLLQRAQLRVLAKAVEAADGDVHQARGSVEKAGAQEVEAQETKQRREHEADAGKALAASVHRRRLQRRILILLGQIGVERFRRRVQKIPIEAADRDLAQYPLVHVIVAPACMAAVKQPQVPVRIARAVSEPAAEEAIAPWHRIGLVLRLLHCGPDGARELR